LMKSGFFSSPPTQLTKPIRVGGQARVAMSSP
jgi:hypothetical protein